MLAKSTTPRSALLLFPGGFLSEVNIKSNPYSKPLSGTKPCTCILFVADNDIKVYFSKKSSVKTFSNTFFKLRNQFSCSKM